MDPRHRDQQHHHHQGQLPAGLQNNNSPYSGGAYNYQEANSLQSQDDFNQFFNTEGPPTFQNGWENSSILDPQLHAPGFSNQSSSDHWPPQQQHQGMAQDAFINDFARPQSDYGFTTYSGHTYPSFPSNTFDPALPYANSSLLNSNHFPDASNGFVTSNRPMQGETVSPSVLESYPNPYGPFANQSDDQTPSPDCQTPAQSVEPQVIQKQRNDYYSEELAKRLADSIPTGVSEGNMLVKDPNNFTKTIPSQKLATYVYVGTRRLESDDSRVIYPRTVQRKSSKELKRKVVQDQGQHPWEALQQPILKKLKMKTKLGVPKVAKAQAAVASDTIKLESISSESSSEESSSEDDSEDFGSDQEAEMEEPSPLPTSRPQDAAKAAEYDTTKAVWAKRSAVLPGSAIRKAMGDLWNVVRIIRDAFRSASLDLQQAEAMKDETKANKSRTQLNDQRRTFEKVVKAVLTHGHPDIVDRLGEMHPLIAVFYQFIAERFKAADYNHAIIHDSLKLMCGCNTIDQELFKQTKLDKVIPKLAKKGNEAIKSLCEELLRSVDKASAQKGGESKAKEEAAASPSKPLPRSNGTPDVVAGVKRPRSTEVVSSQPAKKPAASVGVKNTTISAKSANGVTSKPGVALKTGAAPKAQNKSSASSLSASQPKEKHVTAKPSSFLAGLQSASKKPGTSIAAQKAALIPENKTSKPAENKSVTASAPKAGFSFSQTLADLGKAKPVESTKQATEDRPTETDEQKQQRLRKEERRKLRVKFKPGDSLVEIKIFHHDPEEELGHDENMVRDVGDVKSEGRMLKMHKDMDLEDNEDEEDIVDLEVPWHSPSENDYSDIDYDIILQNYTSHGGQMDIRSPEKEKQEQREKEKLVAIYSTLSDIPPNPREPLDPYAGDSAVETTFGEPSSETRAREARFYERRNGQNQVLPLQQPMVPVPNMNALLSMLNSQVPQQQPQLQQQAPAPSALESIFAQFSGNQAAQQVQMQMPPQQQQQPSQFQLDHGIMNALSIFNQQNQQQQQQQQQVQYNPNTAPVPNTNLSALLAQMSGQAGGQNHEMASQFHENPERKRQWSSYENEGTSNKRFRGDFQTGEKPKFILPCRYFKEGKCRKGASCTYVHDTS